MKKLLLFILVLMFAPLQTVSAETLTFTTYYPAPFGAYDRLRLVPRNPAGMACNAANVGTLFIENATNTLQICTGDVSTPPAYQMLSGIWTQDSDNIFPSDTVANPDIKVGIGTAQPLSRLHVNNAGNNIPLGNDNGVTDALSGEIMLTGTDPSLNIIAQDDTFVSGHIKLTDVHKTTGNVNDMWTVLRSTYNRGSDMRIVYVSRNDPEKRFWVALPAVTIQKTGLIGLGTKTPLAKLHVDEGALLSTGTYNSGWTEPNLGAGTRMLWYPRKAAFRAGTVYGTKWDNNEIGIFSLATGEDTKASGEVATAMGYKTEASGEVATAIGVRTTASGSFSVATGYETQAKNCNATATGYKTTASGFASTSMGISTTAQAFTSVAIGRWNIISGDKDHWVATDPLFVIGNGTNDATRSNALTVLKNGKVGIGVTDPTHILHINGEGRSTQAAWATSSDGRVKTDITPLRGSLQNILRLNPVAFKWAPEYRAAHPELPDHDINFIAQEVEAVFPDMVRTTSETFGETTIEDFRVLNTSALVPRLVEAIKEQQQMIAEQRRMINDLKGRVTELEKGQKL